MKRIITHTLPLLLFGCLWLGLCTSCNNDDDVLDIFVGNNKTWKLTFISRSGSNQWYDFWGANETAKKASETALAKEGNFILNFEGGTGGVNTGGGLTGHAVKYDINGTWNVGEERKLTIVLNGTATESDPLAKAFVNGLKGAIRYEGDTDNLYIYYDEGQTAMRMAFHVQP